MERRHSALTAAGEPWVRLEIETDLRCLQWWEDARAVKPEEMAFAVPLRTSPLPGGRVRVEFAVDPDEYAIGIETSDGYAEAYIELLLGLQASCILDNDEDAEDGEDIYHGPPEPPDDDDIPF